MSRILLAIVGAAVLVAPPTVRAQPADGLSRIAPVINATVETRQSSSSIQADIAAAAARRNPVWVGYRVRTLAGPEYRCESGSSGTVMLEPASELIVLARVTNGRVERLRTVTAECQIDAGGVSFVWLDGVTEAQSAEWLAGQVTASATTAERDRRVVLPALSALIWHRGDQPLRTVVALARSDSRVRVRGEALFWLSQRAGATAVDAIRSALDDPETEVKRHAVFALSRLPADEGVPLLIDVARRNDNRDVRRQAMFWLGQSKDPRAVTFFEELLR
jgi:hypothetical protein